jgi:hypothetical protein
LRTEYEKTIEDLMIVDHLKSLEGVPYSRKLKIIDFLWKEYEDSTKINLILEEYKRSYIELGRANLMIINNVLKNIGKRV